MKSTQTQVRRMEPWEADDEPQLPAVRKSSNFVAPLPPPVSNTITVLRTEAHQMQPVLPVQQVVSVATSHWDRARGFALATLPLSVVTGVFAATAAIAMFGQPLALAVVLKYFISAFFAVWFASFVLYVGTSPDFVLLLQAVGVLRLFGKEQDFFHERIRHHEGMPAKKGRR